MCLFCLFSVSAALAIAHRRDDRRLSRILEILRLGLILSACSYLLPILDPPRTRHFSFFSFALCLSGTALIWAGFREHWKMQQERSRMSDTDEEEEKSGPVTALRRGLPLGLPSLTSRAAQVLLQAQDEARCRRQSCVDTEHLLLGLLGTPQSEGVRILARLGVGLEKIPLALRESTASNRRSAQNVPDMPLPPMALTESAQEVIVLAGQEAHRFDKTCIGTEHLLLGLVLKGSGIAAAVLFGQGVTVDGIRAEILKAKKPSNLT